MKRPPKFVWRWGLSWWKHYEGQFAGHWHYRAYRRLPLRLVFLRGFRRGWRRERSKFLRYDWVEGVFAAWCAQCVFTWWFGNGSDGSQSVVLLFVWLSLLHTRRMLKHIISQSNLNVDIIDNRLNVNHTKINRLHDRVADLYSRR